MPWLGSFIASQWRLAGQVGCHAMRLLKAGMLLYQMTRQGFNGCFGGAWSPSKQSRKPWRASGAPVRSLQHKWQADSLITLLHWRFKCLRTECHSTRMRMVCCSTGCFYWNLAQMTFKPNGHAEKHSGLLIAISCTRAQLPKSALKNVFLGCLKQTKHFELWKVYLYFTLIMIWGRNNSILNTSASKRQASVASRCI